MHRPDHPHTPTLSDTVRQVRRTLMAAGASILLFTTPAQADQSIGQPGTYPAAGIPTNPPAAPRNPEHTGPIVGPLPLTSGQTPQGPGEPAGRMVRQPPVTPDPAQQPAR